MEALPPELKAKILHHFPEIRTLSAIVHVSPSCYQVYLTQLDQFLMNDLAQRCYCMLESSKCWGSIPYAKMD